MDYEYRRNNAKKFKNIWDLKIIMGKIIKKIKEYLI